jgi:hypothetical protein
VAGEARIRRQAPISFEGLKATSSPGSCWPGVTATVLIERGYATGSNPRFPDFRPIGTPIPVPGRRIGNQAILAESGIWGSSQIKISAPIPGQIENGAHYGGTGNCDFGVGTERGYA